jgi:hypothetical protein
VAPYKAVVLDDDLNVVARRFEYVPPPFAFIKPDIKAETRFATALGTATDGLSTLSTSLKIAAQVIETMGRYVGPPEVYVRIIAGKRVYSLEDPRKSGAD